MQKSNMIYYGISDINIPPCLSACLPSIVYIFILILGNPSWPNASLTSWCYTQYIYGRFSDRHHVSEFVARVTVWHGNSMTQYWVGWHLCDPALLRSAQLLPNAITHFTVLSNEGTVTLRRDGWEYFFRSLAFGSPPPDAVTTLAWGTCLR